MTKKLPILEIEDFSWPSKRLEIKEQSYSPRKSLKALYLTWIVALIAILGAVGACYWLLSLILDPEPIEASYEEPCDNLDRYINGSEFKEFCGL